MYSFLFLGILVYGNEITEPIENTKKIKRIKSKILKNISDTVALRLFKKKLMTLKDFKNVTEKEV